MNLNFKTICSAAVLCFVGNVFAMDSNSLKENSSNSKEFSQFIPIRQANHTQNKEILKNEYKKLIAAVKKKDIKTLESLIGQGVDIDETVFGNFSTPLKKAVKKGYTDVITFLLNNGADPNKAPKVLNFAVNTGNKDLVELALAKGANPNKALKLAVNSGNKDLVELALLKGADPNVQDKENNSMLMLALKKEYIEIARLFLSNSCSDHILDFIYAGKSKQPMSNDSIKLKERLAIFKNYDTPNEKGESPLIQAIRNLKHSDLQEILTLLLKNKLVLNRIDSSTGYSVLTLAKLNERGEEIIKLLEDAGARDVYIEPLESPIIRLYKYCLDKSNNLSWSDLKFENEIKKGKFGCFITIDRGDGNDKEVYDNGKSYNSKEEAQNKTADYTLRKLMKNKGLPAPDNRGPVKKLNDYCLDKSTPINLSDITYIRDINEDNTCNCKIKLKDEIFDLNLRCKTEMEAERIIAEYVYNLLVAKAKNGEASSSGTN
ncbi:MAG: ankyrin repeat domain-containing protein [Alphaproteobacteria bacterium]|nr:ankyrin repeat domain-containing protein [Alphaproteobacteria bacterium]